jgi:hypothetical protein
VLGILGAATSVAALVALDWGLVTLGVAGVAIAGSLREGDRRPILPLILGLLAIGATGAGMALVGAI